MRADPTIRTVVPTQTIAGLRAQRTQKMNKLRQLEWRWERDPSNPTLTRQLRDYREVVSTLESKIMLAELDHQADMYE